MVVETSLIFPRGGEPPRLWIRVVKKKIRVTKNQIYIIAMGLQCYILYGYLKKGLV